MEQALKDGTYRPAAVRHVEIPKGAGKPRALGIPTMLDRLIQQAIAQVLGPRFDPGFSESSFGFRPGRCAHGALRQVQRFIGEGYRVAVDLDLAKFFDTSPKERLMQCVEARIGDGRVLARLRAWLDQDVVSELARWTPTGGTPKGRLQPTAGQ